MTSLPPDPSEPARERILQVAFDLFARHGYQGTTTRAICKGAGVNGAALNYHWRSKDQLWQAVCERCGTWFLEVVQKIDLSAAPNVVAEAFLGGLFDAAVADPRPMRIIAWAALQADAMDYESTAQVFRPMVDLANQFFLLQQAQGKLPAGVDVEAVIPLVQGMLVYTFLNRAGLYRYFQRDFQDPEFATRFRRQVVRAALLLLDLEGGRDR